MASFISFKRATIFWLSLTVFIFGSKTRLKLFAICAELVIYLSVYLYHELELGRGEESQ